MDPILDGRTTLSRRAMLVGSVGLLLTRDALAKVALASPAPALAPAPPPTKPRARVDLDRFVADCIAAHSEPAPQQAVREVLARAVSDPPALLAAVGEPRQAGLTVLHRSPTLTVISAAWAPQMNLMPHNHRMWALIGLYTGREDNILWQRSDAGVSAIGAKCLFQGDVAELPVDVIHSVTNPLERMTGAIHIYGGDFIATTRSHWNPETLAEEPFDGDKIRRIFERANERMRCLGELGG